MVDGRAVLRRELGQVVLVGHDVAVPGHEVEWAVVLLDSFEPAVHLVDDLPVDMQLVVDGRDRV